MTPTPAERPGTPAPHPSRHDRPSAMQPDLDYQRQRRLESSAHILAPPTWREPLGEVRSLLAESVVADEPGEMVREALGIVRGLLEGDRYRPGFSVHVTEDDMTRLYVELLAVVLDAARLINEDATDVAARNLRREWETRIAQLEAP